MAKHNVIKDIRMLTAGELSVFAAQLAMMIEAGISPEDSISILLEESEYSKEQQLLSAMKAELGAGELLSVTLRRLKVFPDNMVNMTEIGERSGRLDEVLSALSRYYRQEEDLAQSVKRAVAVPAIMVVLVSIVLMVLIAQVLPIFRQVFMELGVTLSPLAEGLMRFGNVSQDVAIVLVAALVVIVVTIYIMLQNHKSAACLKAWVDQLFFRGKLGLAVARSRFALGMSMMLASGMNIDEAMINTERLLAKSTLIPRIRSCRELMEQGLSFSAAASQAHLFPGMQLGLLTAALRTGNGEAIMADLAQRNEAEAEDIFIRLIGKVEPALIIFLCLAVGMVLLSVMMPLIAVMQSIGV